MAMSHYNQGNNAYSPASLAFRLKLSGKRKALKAKEFTDFYDAK